MEYLSGGQLKRVFEKRLNKHDDVKKPLFTEDEVAAIVRAVLKGLAPVHALDYIHRDIKPENIILAPLPETSQSESVNKD
jgi:serine/threonine protein kinase